VFGFSTADWIFIGFIILVIVGCVAISDMRRK
jgi:Sec-independent protein translocase protein TatA